jgi:uncharacterized membrane protein
MDHLVLIVTILLAVFAVIAGAVNIAMLAKFEEGDPESAVSKQVRSMRAMSWVIVLLALAVAVFVGVVVIWRRNPAEAKPNKVIDVYLPKHVLDDTVEMRLEERDGEIVVYGKKKLAP